MESISQATSVMPSKEAEEFMALLLSAQGTKHNCPYCAYLKKAEQAQSNRMSSQRLIGVRRIRLERLRAGMTVSAQRLLNLLALVG
jgi:hypothetical protein